MRFAFRGIGFPSIVAAACVVVSLPAFTTVASAAARSTSTLTLSGTPATRVLAGQSYDFTPALGGNSRSVRFSITNKPVWASFDSRRGRLSGRPTIANVGTTSNIVIAATNGYSIAMLPAFSIAVTGPSNAAPVISGTPPVTATVGKAYTFTPKASDANGDALKFSVRNLPAWASFSTTSGTLSGTPAAAGTYSGIAISVSDGKTSISLPAFAITVAAASAPAPTTGTATLSWQRPGANLDGTPLTNLAGYKVLYGTNPASLDKTLVVAGAAITSVVIENLAKGTYYFAVKAYTTSGAESDPSGMVSKTI